MGKVSTHVVVVLVSVMLVYMTWMCDVTTSQRSRARSSRTRGNNGRVRSTSIRLIQAKDNTGSVSRPGSKSGSRSRSPSRSSSYRPKCDEVNYRTCPCGKGETLVQVEKCKSWTKWGPLCEPCEPLESLCRKLENCSQCVRENPQAICAECPLDRHGLNCEHERPCRAPSVADNVTVHPFETDDDVFSLEFGCEDDDQVLDGPSSLECDENTGQWNSLPPTCVVRKPCFTLPDNLPFPFSRVKFFSSERLVYACAEGYEASGPVLETAMECNVHGVWVIVGEHIECVVEQSPKCLTLPTYLGAHPVEGTAVNSAYRNGEIVSYECSQGFEPQNSEKMIFRLNCTGESWIGEIPACFLRGCLKIYMENASVSYNGRLAPLSNTDSSPLYVDDNTVASITCLEGFDLIGQDEITCSGGQWLPELPRGCVPMREPVGEKCSTTFPFVVSEPNGTQVYPGETVKFGCVAGRYRKMQKVAENKPCSRGEGHAECVTVGNKQFELVGDTERICLFNGTLTGSPIECGPTAMGPCTINVTEKQHLRFCRGQGCAKLKKDNFVVDNYYFPENVIPVFAKVEFSCDEGWRLKAEKKDLTCLPGRTGVGSLSGPIPECEEVSVCGKNSPPLNRRILGGEESTIEEWPWQAGLFRYEAYHGQKDAEFLCGATLIHKQWAVTAAHCICHNHTDRLLPASQLKVTYGLSTFLEAKEKAIDNSGRFDVVRVLLPPDNAKYNPATLDNDIALLKLKSPIDLSHHVGLACLPEALHPEAHHPEAHHPTCSDGRLATGKQGVVTGWGVTREDLTKPSHKLRKIQLTVANNTHCQGRLKEEGYTAETFTASMLCATSSGQLEDIADGDSGGPFVVKGHAHWVLEGIVSWSRRRDGNNDTDHRTHITDRLLNARANMKFDGGYISKVPPACNGTSCLSGYTRVARYTEWISREIGLNNHGQGCL